MPKPPNRKIDRSLCVLDPGFYRVTEDVTNPKPDRRMTRNPFAEPVVKKGTRVQVQDYWLGAFKDDVEKVTTELRSGYGRLARNDELFDVLVPFLKREPDTVGAVVGMWTSGGRTQEIVAMLLDQGKIDLDDVRDAMQKVDAIWEDEDDEDKAEAANRAFAKRHGLS